MTARWRCRPLLAGLPLVVSLVVLGGLAAAQDANVTPSDQAPHAAAATFSLTWWTVDGGAGHRSAGSYTLGGTAGQPDAGELTGGGFALGGGYWGGGATASTPYRVHLPLIVR